MPGWALARCETDRADGAETWFLPARVQRPRRAPSPIWPLCTATTGVWKLMDRRAGDVAGVPVPVRVPLDVDSWEDDRAVLEEV